MPEQVVKQVGFLQIVQLFARTDQVRNRKSACGEKGEEDVLGYQTGDRDDGPDCPGAQSVRQVCKVGNVIGPDIEDLQTLEKLVADLAGKQFVLPSKEITPDGVVLVRITSLALVDDDVVDRMCAVVVRHGLLLHPIR